MGYSRAMNPLLMGIAPHASSAPLWVSFLILAVAGIVVAAQHRQH